MVENGKLTLLHILRGEIKMKIISNHKGFTLIELLISMAILGLVLAALTSLFVSQSRHHTAQNEILEMQGNARAAMEFVTRTLKNSVAGTVDIGGVDCNNSITFMAIEDFGMATGGSLTTLSDNTKSWTLNQWENFHVTIVSGAGSGQTRTIISNTASSNTANPNQLTLDSAWTTAPDNTSEYRILSDNTFSLPPGNILRYTRNKALNQPLAENITCFTVQGVGSPITRLDITITAETPNILPDRGTKGSITLRSSVDLRN